MMRMATFFFCFLGCLSGNALLGQNTGVEDADSGPGYHVWIADLSYSVFDPINNFGREVPGGKSGLSASVLRQIKPKSQMFIGLSGYYTRIARDVQENVTFEGDEVDDIANSNMLGFDGIFRYYPDMVIGNFEPYVEGNIGYRTFYTVTKSYFPEFDETTDIETTEFNGALSFGFGLGTYYFVNDNWAINFKFNYQVANIARYYVPIEGSNNLDPLDNLKLENSQTDLLRFDFGVSYIY